MLLKTTLKLYIIMKKIALIFTIALLASTINAFGVNKDNKTNKGQNTPYSIKVENGIETKVYINNDEKTGEPTTRTVYITDVEGKRLGTILYTWDSSKGWVQNTKTEYQYNNDQLSKIIKNKWDSRKSEWVKQSEQEILS